MPNLYDYCVMGVVTDLALKAGVIKKFPDVSNLIPEVQKWAGFMTADGEFTDSRGREHSFIEMNDDGYASFKKFARIIEQEPEGLFKK